MVAGLPGGRASAPLAARVSPALAVDGSGTQGRPDQPDDQPGQQGIAEQGEQGGQLKQPLAARGLVVPEIGTARQRVGNEASERRRQEMAQVVEDPKEAGRGGGAEELEEEPQEHQNLQEAKQEGEERGDDGAPMRSTLRGRFKNLELLCDALDLCNFRGDLALLGLSATRRPGTAALRDSRGGGAWSGRLTAW